MKFEDLLMQQPRDQEQRRLHLQEEVETLEGELDSELKLKRVLQCASKAGPLHPSPYISSFLPPKVQVILAELVMVEEEIVWLERKVDELKLILSQEKNKSRECEMLQLKPRRGWPNQKQLICNQTDQLKHGRDVVSRSQNFEKVRNYMFSDERRASVDSIADIQSITSSSCTEVGENSRRWRKNVNLSFSEAKETNIQKPNKLSEELMKCLVSIFLKLNQPSLFNDEKGSAKHGLVSCMNSKGFVSKTPFNCKVPTSAFDDIITSDLDPYGLFPDLEGGGGSIRDVGHYKNFVQITGNSLDMSRVSECFLAMGKLRNLIHKLRGVDLTLLSYKQKLAFWINIYNACIMHAFLQHGLPSTPEKQLALMNKAAVNVGGIVLNALAIEHFILRHPSESNHGSIDEKERLLRHAYGLGYPEPNITFALCRGTWSSPALRIYTPDEVVNELGRAKVEYLEASVGVVTSKKRVVVPKLLESNMRDFADDIESLLEWIYSQLPHFSPLKRPMTDCLIHQSKPVSAEISPYSSQFRYLLSL